MRVETTHNPMRAQLRSSSGRSSKVIKDRHCVEASVEVRGMGRLILSVDNEGRYALHASLEGGGEAPASTTLASGEMGPVEYEPD